MAKTNTQPKAETTPAPIVKANARAHLRAMFDKVGAVATKEQVFGIRKEGDKEVADYKAITINTHLTDFKNPKYAGKQGVISIVKLNDGTYKRVA